MIKYSALILSLLFSHASISQNWNEVYFSLPEVGLQMKDDQKFGSAVDIESDYAVISSLIDYTGKVYVLKYADENWEILCELQPSNPHRAMFFGSSVSISGDHIVVGAYGENLAGNYSGAAYVFERNENGWEDATETAILRASDAAIRDYFGHAISVSGNNIVVGAYKKDDNGPNSGAAYLFTKSSRGWHNMYETAKLTATDNEEEDLFGSSVDISNDHVVIGAYYHRESAIWSGIAYVYSKPDKGWQDMTETAKLSPSDDDEYQRFGYSVSISGENIVVGSIAARGNHIYSGAAYVFTMPSVGWENMTETAKLVSSNGYIGDRFGAAVYISGDAIVVGANSEEDETSTGETYVFYKEGDTWSNQSETAILSASDFESEDLFGYAVAISENHVISTSTLDNDRGFQSGAAYTFTKPELGWEAASETQKILPPLFYSNERNYYGDAVTQDQDIVVVTNRVWRVLRTNVAYVYKIENEQWTKLAELTTSEVSDFDGFGSSVAISGDDIVIGNYLDDEKNLNAGALYVYTKPADGWTDMTETAKLTSSGDYYSEFLGSDVAFSGSDIVAGADEAAYVFSKPEGGWVNMTETARLTPPADQSDNSQFGIDVDIFESTIIVGASGDNQLGNDVGAVYVFNKPSDGWKDTKAEIMLTVANPKNYDRLGVAVALSDNCIVAGAIGEEYIGSAYVFNKPSDGWKSMTANAILTPQVHQKYDHFGWSVDILNDQIIIGAEDADGIAENSGCVYSYIMPDGGWVDMTESGRLIPTKGDKYSTFGRAVSLLNDQIIVSDPFFNDEDRFSAGAVYQFKHCTPNQFYFDANLFAPLVNTCQIINPNVYALNNCGAKIYGVADVEFPITELGETVITWTFADLYGNSVELEQTAMVESIEKTVFVEDNYLKAKYVEGYAYSWFDCDDEERELPGNSNYYTSVDADGNYAVEITYSECMVVSECIQVNVSWDGTVTVLNGPGLLKKQKIWPNPADDYINIDLNKQELTHIRILSIDGALVKDFGVLKSKQIRLPLDGLNVGVYILSFMSNRMRHTQKLVVNR